MDTTTTDLPACASPGGASPLPTQTPDAGAQAGWPVITAVAGYTPTRYGTLECGAPDSPEWVDVTIVDGEKSKTHRVSVVGDRDDWGLPEISDPEGWLLREITWAIDDAVEQWHLDAVGPGAVARWQVGRFAR